MRGDEIRSEEKQPNGMIYENKFGYHTDSGIYENKGSDIMKLGDIRCTLKVLKYEQ